MRRIDAMTSLDKSTPELIKELEQSLLALNRLKVQTILENAGNGISVPQMIEELIVPALDHIGHEWENGNVALSQVYMSGRICEDLIDVLLPAADPARTDQPAMAIAVLDDYHMLGKRIVYSILRACGFELANYGHMTVDEIINRVKTDKIKILLISVLMLPSALKVKEVRERLDRQGIPVKIVVGGAPFRFDDRLWKDVGADRMGKNASEAVGILRDLINEIG
jgi:methanogenic corrinoid protein MtbC1